MSTPIFRHESEIARPGEHTPVKVENATLKPRVSKLEKFDFLAPFQTISEPVI